MPNVCLPPQAVDKFTRALKAGRIDPAKLSGLSSKARHEYFAKLVGEGDAKTVNSLFESKMLLKNQKYAYTTWAKNVAGLSPEVRRDLISRIERMDTFLDAPSERAFLKDLASTKLGLNVTFKEAKQITNMSVKLQELKAKQRPDGTFSSKADRMAYGYAKVDMGKYLSDLKFQTEKKTAKQVLLSNPAENVSKIAGVAKSVRASLDNSALFRQGWKTLWTNPIVWQKNARNSFKDLYRSGIKNEDVQREVMADIVSRPNYDKYAKMKLALGNVEEEFPSSIQNKIWVLGRGFKASEAAYENFLYRTRADVADKYLKIAEAGGVDITDKKQLAAMGKIINSLTGRGSLGAGEGSKAVSGWTNNIFFSIRFLKSNIDTLTVHAASGGITPFARKQAALNLLKIVSGTSAVLAIANALMPGSVETDTRSSNFGKIKIDGTTFDVTGGMGSLLVLAGRQIAGQTKSSTTGAVTDYGSDFGQTSRADGLTDFITGKFSPAAATVRDILNGKDFDGNKMTPGRAAINTFVPMPATNTANNIKDPNAAPWLLSLIADGLGIGASTNSPQRKLDTEDLGARQQQFLDKVGKTKFNKANDEYNTRYNKWLADNREAIKNDEDPGALVQSAKTRLQNKIYKEYGFKPKTTKRKKNSILEKI